MSACLPTLRPLYRAYKIDSIIGSARRFLSRGSTSARSTHDPLSNPIRLHSVDASSKESNFGGQHTHGPYYLQKEDKHTALTGIHVSSSGPQNDNTSSPDGIRLQNDLFQRSEVV